MSTGEMLTRWTIRLALVCYFAAAGLRTRRGNQCDTAARWFWTAGFTFFVVHVIAAFDTYYGWSHAVAYAETARQTQQLFGIDWGGGIWFNYFFAGIWASDLVFWWLAGRDRYRQRAGWIHAMLHFWFIFMVINGAIIFATGWVRGLTVVALAGLVVLWFQRPRLAN